MIDKIKLLLAVLLVAAGIVAFYKLDAEPEIARVGVVLVTLAAAAALAFWTAPGRAAWVFVKEARLELRKVVWPTRKETTQSTLVVIALVLAAAFFLWAVDLGLIKIVKVITGERF
ncbi:MAG: preprotein translocase subunit SecE [Acidiferrobacteraceae bacterium]